MRLLLPFCALLAAAPAAANILPIPSPDNPRVQRAHWLDGEAVLLTALPETPLTVTLRPGEQITKVTLSDDRSWAVKVSSQRDGFTVLPERGAKPSELSVETDQQIYAFALQTGTGARAAYLVQIGPQIAVSTDPAPASLPGDERWSYRLRGDSALRPAAIFDDGAKTWISFAPGQALPAIFAIGPSGKEQVVNGYMRGEMFVIDRVFQELVFRIDKDRLRARREDREETRR